LARGGGGTTVDDTTESIQAAVNELGIHVLAAVTIEQLAEFQRSNGISQVPDTVRELLAFTTGFDFEPIGRVDFLGRDMSVETFFHSVPILADGSGNFWILDLEADGSGGGTVMYWAHDPAVAIVQAASLTEFREQSFAARKPGNKDTLTFVRRESSRKVWKHDPYLTPAAQARAHGDPTIAAFAATLPSSFHIADLPKAELGSGFSWGKGSPDVRRDGSRLIFGVETN